MTMRTFLTVLGTLLFLMGSANRVAAQVFEAVGTRALGLGGAFVAVASDSSATWWNPAGLAEGPFVDISLARGFLEASEDLPANRDRSSAFAVAVPMLGFSYYRLRLTNIRPLTPTAEAEEGRQDGTAGVAVRNVSVSQLGPTVLQTLLPGVHVGATLKYVRGTVGTAEDSGRSIGEFLDRGEELKDGDAEGRFDLDAGVLAVAGPVRLGGVVKNIREPEFEAGFRLPLQVRIGAAVDVERAGGPALLLAVDADLREYDTGRGTRQVVAVGAEQWLFTRRLGVRAGARFNTVGGEERTAAVGVSVAARSGLYVEGYIAGGNAPEERGWGAAMRVSF